GLPNATFWGVRINGTAYGTTNSTLSVLEPNGTYAYSLQSVAGYVTPAGGNLTIAGAGAQRTADYLPFTVPVTVNETGLPTGTLWWFNVSGGPSVSSRQPTLTVRLANGTYPYDAVSSDPAYESVRGSAAVLGYPVTVSIAFHVGIYAVTFLTAGRAPGLSWTLLWNGTYFVTTNGSLNLSAPDGSFPFGVSVPPGWSVTPSSGQVAVDGAPVHVLLTFRPTTYRVTFQESGLPAGTVWSVTFRGARNSTDGPSISLLAPNGTSRYLLSPVPGWTTANSSGAVVVQGGPVTVNIAWTAFTYPITITESGLPSGTFWTVSVGGRTIGGSSSTLEASEPNGTYVVTPEAVAGYTLSPPSRSVAVQGSSASASFTFQASPPTPAGPTFFGLPLTTTEGYLLIGGLVVAVAIGLGAWAIARGRRRGPVP
ncbi:MAG: hypothetical protein QXG65_06210, partial [Thermoplasmata archaeon]